MDRRRPPLRLLLSTAIMVVMVWTPAHADDIGANKSELIRGLLATVVNISVRKDEVASPASVSASASAAGDTTPAADAGQNIKAYNGSGFVIDPSGLIITNYHVVEGAFEITVMFSDGTLLPGKMLSASRLADLAIVKVETDHSLAAARWGNSDSLRAIPLGLACRFPPASSARLIATFRIHPMMTTSRRMPRLITAIRAGRCSTCGVTSLA
jgi:S1-C subfamily serine protease